MSREEVGVDPKETLYVSRPQPKVTVDFIIQLYETTAEPQKTCVFTGAHRDLVPSQ